jgi:hypothetical protein
LDVVAFLAVLELVPKEMAMRGAVEGVLSVILRESAGEMAHRSSTGGQVVVLVVAWPLGGRVS